MLQCPLQDNLERLIFSRVKPIIDALVPKNRLGFDAKSQLLTQNIEHSFEAKKNAGAVFVNLTVAYDTDWHHGLTCKLLKLLLDNQWSE